MVGAKADGRTKPDFDCFEEPPECLPQLGDGHAGLIVVHAASVEPARQQWASAGRVFRNDARAWRAATGASRTAQRVLDGRESEERRVGKECRSRWSPY